MNGVVSCAQIEEQIAALEQEHANGRQRLSELEADLERTQTAIANISGAVIALRQLLILASEGLLLGEIETAPAGMGSA